MGQLETIERRNDDALALCFRIAAIAGCIMAGVVVALGAACLPGHGGAFVVRACAVCVFGGFAIAGYRRMERAGKPVEPSPSHADNGDEDQSKYVAATALGGALLGAAATFAVGCVNMGDNVRFYVGIAGLVASVCALVSWCKWYERDQVRLRAGQHSPASSPLVASCSSALVVALGLGACFSIRMAPLDGRAAYAVACGALVAIALAALCWWLTRTSAFVTQLDSLNQQLESTVNASNATKKKLSKMTQNYDTLMTRHRNELESNKEMAAEIERLRSEQQKPKLQGIDLVCSNITEEYRLSKRESDVLLLLARGWDRKSIAESLHVGVSTVGTHVMHLYRKLNVHGGQELIDFVRRYQ